MKPTIFYAVTPTGIFPCSTHGLALSLIAEFGGLICDYDPRLVLVPPEPADEPVFARAA